MPSASYAAFSINTGRVESARLDWTNALRKEQWLTAYVIDSKLTATATEWSSTAKTRWYISHERAKWDWYYNYQKIVQWFADRSIVFQNIFKATFSESIWYGYLSCTDGDCTDALIQSTKSTWNFYMSEKWKKSQPHYRALIHKYFWIMWVGVIVDEKLKRYYLTVHYGTKIVEPKNK
jgi:uncharacterized protein YkwD